MPSTPIAVELNEHTMVFYVGRGLTGPSPYPDIPENWVDAGSWALGACAYAIYREPRAVVYDSMMTRELGEWVRDYLAREKGISRFTLVLSHWHLDHIAGNPAFGQETIIGLDLTRAALVRHRAQIEAGTLWGPPALEVVLPSVTFRERLTIHLNGLAIEFHHFNIHSRDANLMIIPSDGSLFAGDALEDPITFISEPEEIENHITELARLRELTFDRIFPNHGSLDIIKMGGYRKSFIDAIKEYDGNMLHNVSRPGFLDMSLEESIPGALSDGVVSIWEPYRSVHENNLKLVYDSFKGKRFNGGHASSN